MSKDEIQFLVGVYIAFFSTVSVIVFIHII